jgi:hypothetical protein
MHVEKREQSLLVSITKKGIANASVYGIEHANV